MDGYRYPKDCLEWSGYHPKDNSSDRSFSSSLLKKHLDRCFINMRVFLFQQFFFQQPATEENDSLSNQMLLYDYIYVRRKETGYLKKNPV